MKEEDLNYLLENKTSVDPEKDDLGNLLRHVSSLSIGINKEYSWENLDRKLSFKSNHEKSIFKLTTISWIAAACFVVAPASYIVAVAKNTFTPTSYKVTPTSFNVTAAGFIVAPASFIVEPTSFNVAVASFNFIPTRYVLIASCF